MSDSKVFSFSVGPSSLIISEDLTVSRLSSVHGTPIGRNVEGRLFIIDECYIPPSLDQSEELEKLLSEFEDFLDYYQIVSTVEIKVIRELDFDQTVELYRKHRFLPTRVHGRLRRVPRRYFKTRTSQTPESFYLEYVSDADPDNIKKFSIETSVIYDHSELGIDVISIHRLETPEGYRSSRVLVELFTKFTEWLDSYELPSILYPENDRMPLPSSEMIPLYRQFGFTEVLGRNFMYRERRSIDED